MIKILYIIFLSFIVANCSFKKVVKHHGVPFLEKKQSSLVINKTNKNDIIKILGSPSTKSKFDNDLWIYIERKQTQSELKNLGRMKIFKNDVLVLEIDDYGILKKKEFYNKDDMQNLKVAKGKTDVGFQRNSFIFDFMSSMRQKINDPLGQRAKKLKKLASDNS
jgi:outer membrane protein assembly factor BamE (lipoprotein component of BamABCDE complex)